MVDAGIKAKEQQDGLSGKLSQLAGGGEAGEHAAKEIMKGSKEGAEFFKSAIAEAGRLAGEQSAGKTAADKTAIDTANKEYSGGFVGLQKDASLVSTSQSMGKTNAELMMAANKEGIQSTVVDTGLQKASERSPEQLQATMNDLKASGLVDENMQVKDGKWMEARAFLSSMNMAGQHAIAAGGMAMSGNLSATGGGRVGTDTSTQDVSGEKKEEYRDVHNIYEGKGLTSGSMEGISASFRMVGVNPNSKEAAPVVEGIKRLSNLKDQVLNDKTTQGMLFLASKYADSPEEFLQNAEEFLKKGEDPETGGFNPAQFIAENAGALAGGGAALLEVGGGIKNAMNGKLGGGITRPAAIFANAIWDSVTTKKPSKVNSGETLKESTDKTDNPTNNHGNGESGTGTDDHPKQSPGHDTDLLSKNSAQSIANQDLNSKQTTGDQLKNLNARRSELMTQLGDDSLSRSDRNGLATQIRAMDAERQTLFSQAIEGASHDRNDMRDLIHANPDLDPAGASLPQYLQNFSLFIAFFAVQYTINQKQFFFDFKENSIITGAFTIGREKIGKFFDVGDVGKSFWALAVN